MNWRRSSRRHEAMPPVSARHRRAPAPSRVDAQLCGAAVCRHAGQSSQPRALTGHSVNILGCSMRLLSASLWRRRWRHGGAARRALQPSRTRVRRLKTLSLETLRIQQRYLPPPLHTRDARCRALNTAALPAFLPPSDRQPPCNHGAPCRAVPRQRAQVLPPACRLPAAAQGARSAVAGPPDCRPSQVEWQPSSWRCWRWRPAAAQPTPALWTRPACPQGPTTT